MVKNPLANARDTISGSEDPLEEGMAIHSSIFAWRIPWTEELGRLQSIVSQRVRHDWGDLVRMHPNFSTFVSFVIWQAIECKDFFFFWVSKK